MFRSAATAFLYLLSILGWGEVVCFRLSRWKEDFPDYLAARLLSGCIALYAAFILLGTAGVLSSVPVTIVVACGVVVLLTRLRSLALKFKDAIRPVVDWPPVCRFLLASICVLGVLEIVYGFTPLVLYDSQIYQLLAPVQFLKAGHLVRIPWNVLTNPPMALQLTVGMSWVGDPTGDAFKILLAAFGCLLILAAAKIGGELGLHASLLAGLFVACYPEFWLDQSFGVVDLPIAAFMLYGMFWWRRALAERSWTWTFHAATAFGFVLASRYQGIVFVGLATGILLIEELRWRRESTSQLLVRTAALVLIAAVVVSPWLIRNYSNFGNPVYPLLHSRLGGSEWSAAQADRFQREVMGPSLGEVSGVQEILAPVNALLMVPSNGVFGLGLLLGTLFALWAGSGTLRTYAVLGIAGLVLWGLIHPTVGVNLFRFNAAGLVLMLASTGAILGSDRLREWKGLQIGIGMALCSLLIALVAVQGVIPVWQTLTDSNARTLFWRANVPSWNAFEVANAKLDPTHDKVLLIGESRALWLNVPFIAPTAFNGPQLDEVFSPQSEPSAWVQHLRTLGVTHLLISYSEWQRFQSGYGYFKPPAGFTPWLQSLRVLFDDGRGTLLLSVL